MTLTWADIAKGDAVMLKGKRYVVTKYKREGKRVAVTVVGGAGKFKSEVKAKDAVTRAGAETKPRDRWATKKEAEELLGKMPAGDSNKTKPPVKPIGDPWETPRDRIERKLDKLMGAFLVAETLDEAEGWYVPPVDITTLASHVALFHGVDPSEYGIDDLLELHENQHAAALKGVALAVNHWHTKTRPPNG